MVPCSESGFTEPVPLETAGALLPHLSTLTKVSFRFSENSTFAVFFCGTVLLLMTYKPVGDWVLPSDFVKPEPGLYSGKTEFGFARGHLIIYSLLSFPIL